MSTETNRQVTTEETPMPPRPKKPTRTLGNGANDRQAREHYSVMLDYWVEEAKWWELRAKRLEAENGRLRAEMAHYEDEDEPPEPDGECYRGTEYAASVAHEMAEARKLK